MSEPASPVRLIPRRRHGDARGWLAAACSEPSFRALGITCRFVQDNHSLSAPQYTLRGRHFQTPPHGQDRLMDCNPAYLERGQLSVETMGRGFAWLGTGTPDSLLDAAEFVRILEKRQGFKIASPEEIAFRGGFISAAELEKTIISLGKSDYGNYLRTILQEAL